MINIKNLSYEEKIEILSPFFNIFVESIKKDLKQEHLKKRPQFFRSYFKGKTISKLTVEELEQGYSLALKENRDTTLAEYLCNRWVLRNIDVYEFFEKQLSSINPKFDEIEIFEAAVEEAIISQSVSSFGPLKTYLFCMINSVVFSQEAFDKLSRDSMEMINEMKKSEENAKNEQSSAKSLHSFEKQVQNLTNRYEKKLDSLHKKYMQDTDALKKQVSLLQKRLNEAKQEKAVL
jgi:hypothetical protein